MREKKENFKWNDGFQFDILRLVYSHRKPDQVLEILKVHFFKNLYHQTLLATIQRFYKAYSVPPREINLFEVELNRTFRHRDYAENLNEKDRDYITEMVPDLMVPLKDSEVIYQELRKFVTFIELTRVITSTDLKNPDNYEVLPDKVVHALRYMEDRDSSRGLLLAREANKRVARRKLQPDTLPTPLRQMNRLLNSGGLERGSVVTLVDKPKKGKTFNMVNLAMGYVKMGKKVVYFDFENGEKAIESRFDQNLIGVKKIELTEPDNEAKIKRVWRRARKIGGEVYVIRMLANKETVRDCKNEMRRIEDELGIRFDIACFDYPVLMNSTQGDRDDIARVGNVYLNIKNFAEEEGLDVCYCAHHVRRDVDRGTEYTSDNFAKNIDITRHVDAMWGINQTKEEEEMNVQRINVIDQRDGGKGRVWCYVDIPTQRMREFTQAEVKAIEAQIEAQARQAEEEDKPRRRRGPAPQPTEEDQKKRQEGREKTSDV